MAEERCEGCDGNDVQEKTKISKKYLVSMKKTKVI